MALDLYLQEDESLPETGENRFLSFEDDGYFWFLYEFFQDLSEQTGEAIELYEDAFFKGKDLDLFNQTIQNAKQAVSQKSTSWEEFIGTIVHKGEQKTEKIFSTVQKEELESILSKLENGIVKAKKKNIGIFFFGD